MYSSRTLLVCVLSNANVVHRPPCPESKMQFIGVRSVHYACDSSVPSAQHLIVNKNLSVQSSCECENCSLEYV